MQWNKMVSKIPVVLPSMRRWWGDLYDILHLEMELDS